ncbi:HMG1/2-like protein [Solanum dulcamara]|uniref:HMG1/2-like protein n=1 Tax=Solanum dulcamara TaxID=45834 RepID=UPI00248640AE|nr:HMG1/2-like protein [Solanum dulcamara]
MIGGKSNAKANNMLGVKKKALETKEAKKAAKDPEKPKSPRPAGAFFIFMKDFRKQFKEKNPKNKSMAAVGIAGGEKWKQLSDAEKAPYMAEAKKWLADYYKKKGAYNEGVAAGAFEEKESYKSLFEVD